MTSLPDSSDATLVVSRIVHRDAASLFEMWTTLAHLVRWRRSHASGWEGCLDGLARYAEAGKAREVSGNGTGRR